MRRTDSRVMAVLLAAVMLFSLTGCWNYTEIDDMSIVAGVIIAGVIIIGVSVRNLLVLGPEILSSLYFPSFVAVSRINIGDFLTRIEGSAAIVFVTSLFIKASLCLYVTCQGIARVFKLQSYRSVVLQMGLIMVYMSDFIYKDITQMQDFAYHIYKVYALPFEVFIPLLLWAMAEIMIRRAQNRRRPQHDS